MDEKLLSRLKLLAAPDKDETLGKRLTFWTDKNDGITDVMEAQLTDEEHAALTEKVKQIVIGFALGSLKGIAKEMSDSDPLMAMEMIAAAVGIMTGVRQHKGFETVASTAFILGFNLAYIDAPIPDTVPEEETKTETQPETQA